MTNEELARSAALVWAGMTFSDEKEAIDALTRLIMATARQIASNAKETP